MSKIQYVDSCPEYIKLFINNNLTNIKKIYDDNSKDNIIGLFI